MKPASVQVQRFKHKRFFFNTLLNAPAIEQQKQRVLKELKKITQREIH